MDMTADHLVRRGAGNLLHLPKSKELINTIYGRLCIRPDARSDLLFPFASYFQPFERTSYLLDRNTRRGLLAVQLQDRCGRAPLHKLLLLLLFLFFLFVCKPQLLLPDTGERFILLLLNLPVHLLVELRRHFCTKENRKFKK